MSGPVPQRRDYASEAGIGEIRDALFAKLDASRPKLGDPPCPDIGQRLARFLVLRAIGRSFDELARAFNLSYEQVRLLLARHGEPPRLAGAQAADMARALAAAAQVQAAAPTHAARTHAALETNQESA